MPSKRILVISQDRWLLDRLRDILDSAGFEAEIALSGAVGVNIAVSAGSTVTAQNVTLDLLT